MNDLGDVGMIQRCQRLGFTLEARKSLRIVREGVWQDLDRDLPAKVRVGGAVDFAHAAFPNQGDDFIGPRRAPGANGILCLDSQR